MFSLDAIFSSLCKHQLSFDVTLPRSEEKTSCVLTLIRSGFKIDEPNGVNVNVTPTHLRRVRLTLTIFLLFQQRLTIPTPVTIGVHRRTHHSIIFHHRINPSPRRRLQWWCLRRSRTSWTCPMHFPRQHHCRIRTTISIHRRTMDTRWTQTIEVLLLRPCVWKLVSIV